MPWSTTHARRRVAIVSALQNYSGAANHARDKTATNRLRSSVRRVSCFVWHRHGSSTLRFIQPIGVLRGQCPCCPDPDPDGLQCLLDVGRCFECGDNRGKSMSPFAAMPSSQYNEAPASLMSRTPARSRPESAPETCDTAFGDHGVSAPLSDSGQQAIGSTASRNPQVLVTAAGHWA